MARLLISSLVQITFIVGCIAVFDSKFIREHQCVLDSTSRIHYTFAPFNVSWYTCRNVFPSEVGQVTCERRCAHPLFPKKRLSLRLRPMPMYQCRSVKIRRGNISVSVKMPIPYACHCVLLSKFLTRAQKPEC